MLGGKVAIFFLHYKKLGTSPTEYLLKKMPSTSIGVALTSFTRRGFRFNHSDCQSKAYNFTIFFPLSSTTTSIMSQRRGSQGDRLWKQKPVSDSPSPSSRNSTAISTEIADIIGGLSILVNSSQNHVPSSRHFGTAQPESHGTAITQKPALKAKSYENFSTATGENGVVLAPFGPKYVELLCPQLLLNQKVLQI